jgi:hypothetical protein
MKRDIKDTHIYFPVKVLADVKKMAQANRRTVSAEIVLAMENKVREWKAQGQGGSLTNGRQT